MFAFLTYWFIFVVQALLEMYVNRQIIQLEFVSILEAVSRWGDPQLQVSANYSDLTK